MKELVSVVVLLNDVESYIDASLNSIMKQTYTNIEILCINKGVKDNTLKLVEYYAKKDKRIKIIDVDARTNINKKNVGIENAKSKYITFIEAGDIVTSDYIEYLHKRMVASDADIVCVGEFTDKTRINPNATSTTYKGSSILSHYFHMDLTSTVYGKLYNKKVFKTIKFPEVPCFDDLMTSYLIYDSVDKVVNVTVSKYCIVTRKNKKVKDSLLMNKMDICFDMLEYVKVNHPKLVDYCKIKICYEALSLFKQIKDIDYRKQLFRYIKLYRKYALNDNRFPVSKKSLCIRSLFGFDTLRLSLYLEETCNK